MNFQKKVGYGFVLGGVAIALFLQSLHGSRLRVRLTDALANLDYYQGRTQALREEIELMKEKQRAKTGVEIEQGSRPGWLKYSDYELGISFEYPADSFVVLGKGHSQSDRYTVSLYSTSTFNFQNLPVKVAEFANYFWPPTYEDINVPLSVDEGRFEIQGESYDGLHYIIGEGTGCAGGFTKTVAVKLPNDLTAYIYDSETSRNTNPACYGDPIGAYDKLTDNDVFERVTTSPSELRLAEQVIETLEILPEAVQ